LETAQAAIQPSIAGLWLRGDQTPTDWKRTPVRPGK
jgi:hypothetical protein